MDGITLFIITSSVTWTQLMYIRYFVLRSITYTIFSQQNHRWYIIIGSNLNLPIKVLFLSTNNNLSLIVCRHNISFLFLIDLGFLFLGIKLVFFKWFQLKILLKKTICLSMFGLVVFLKMLKKKKKTNLGTKKPLALNFFRVNCKLHPKSLRVFKFYILKF